METFNFCIRPDFNVDNVPAVTTVQFGDGYAQRQKGSINNLLRKFTLKVKVPNVKSLDVDNFLARHAGVEPFYFNDPYTKTKRKVICGAWPATVGKTYTEFSCEFQEVP